MHRLQNKEGKGAIPYALSLPFNLAAGGHSCLFRVMWKTCFLLVPPHSTEGFEESLAPREHAHALSDYHCGWYCKYLFPQPLPLWLFYLVRNTWIIVGGEPKSQVAPSQGCAPTTSTFSLILLQTVTSAWLVWPIWTHRRKLGRWENGAG